MRGLVGAIAVWTMFTGCPQHDAASVAPSPAVKAEPGGPGVTKAEKAKSEGARAAEAKAPEIAAVKDRLVVADEDRGCQADADCSAILSECSMCEGACTGVRVDRKPRYAGKLDCSQYGGKLCNYDCRPEFKIEAPRCVAGRCESVRKE